MIDKNRYSTPSSFKLGQSIPPTLTLGAKPLVVSVFLAVLGLLLMLRLIASLRFAASLGTFTFNEVLIGLNGVLLLFIAWKVAGLRNGTAEQHSTVWTLLATEAGLVLAWIGLALIRTMLAAFAAS